MTKTAHILLVGESDVGKTHYGAQLLGRLDRSESALKLAGAPANLGPFQSAMERISLGLAADHTPSSAYSDSVWPIVDAAGNAASMVWPDYSGEQIKDVIDTKRLPFPWRDRVIDSGGWVIMLRPSRMGLPNDVLTRSGAEATTDVESPIRLSPQSRFIELMQMLLYQRA